MKNIFFQSIVVALSVFMLTACKQENVETHFVKIDYTEWTFNANQNQPFTISVRSNPQEWQITSYPSWLNIEQAGNELIITPEDNVEAAERNTIINISAGEANASITIRQLGDTGRDVTYRYLYELLNAVMSPSGKYVGGFYETLVGEEYQRTAVIIDLATDERTEFGPYDSSLMGMDQSLIITDSGTLYISDNTNGGCTGFSLSTGSYFIPEVIPNYGQPTMQGATPDESVMVAYTNQNPDGLTYGAIKYVDGVPEPLRLPETGNFRNEEWFTGAMPRGCSADGSIIYGTSWENYDYGMLYWDAEGNPDWVGSDLRRVETVKVTGPLGDEIDYNIADGMTCSAALLQISPDGKWIAGNYRTEEVVDGQVVQHEYPAFFNTKTKTTTVFEEYAGDFAMGATNDGIGLIGRNSGMGVTSGYLVDIESGANLGDMLSYVQENFGVTVTKGYINYISPDGNAIMGTDLIYVAGYPSPVSWYVVRH